MYYFTRVDPWTFTWSDALEYGELITRAFERDPLTQHIAGRQYKLYTLSHIQAIRDPRKRLETYLKHASSFDITCKNWAVSTWQNVLQDEYDLHAVYHDTEEENAGRGRLVAYAIWQYPNYMAEKLKQQLGKVGWRWWAYSRWSKAKLWVLGIWYRRVINAHPFFNRRLTVLNQAKALVHDECRLTYDQMGTLVPAQVPTAAYPKSAMVHLAMLGTNPDYQRQGVGQMILSNSLSIIPNTRPIFNNCTLLSGPQKLYLEATDPGIGLYKKFGFEMGPKLHVDCPPWEYNSTFMCLTRY